MYIYIYIYLFRNVRDFTNCTGRYDTYVALEYKYFAYISYVVLYCMHHFVSKFVKILIFVLAIYCLMHLWAVAGSLKSNRWSVGLQLNILYWCLEKSRIFLLFSFHGHQKPLHYRGFTITLRHTTVGTTPLDEWSARRSHLYLNTHNTHNRQTSMPPAGFAPIIPAI